MTITMSKTVRQRAPLVVLFLLVGLLAVPSVGAMAGVKEERQLSKVLTGGATSLYEGGNSSSSEEEEESEDEESVEEEMEALLDGGKKKKAHAAKKETLDSGSEILTGGATSLYEGGNSSSSEEEEESEDEESVEEEMEALLDGGKKKKAHAAKKETLDSGSEEDSSSSDEESKEVKAEMEELLEGGKKAGKASNTTKVVKETPKSASTEEESSSEEEVEVEESSSEEELDVVEEEMKEEEKELEEEEEASDESASKDLKESKAKAVIDHKKEEEEESSSEEEDLSSDESASKDLLKKVKKESILSKAKAFIDHKKEVTVDDTDEERAKKAEASAADKWEKHMMNCFRDMAKADKNEDDFMSDHEYDAFCNLYANRIFVSQDVVKNKRVWQLEELFEDLILEDKFGDAREEVNIYGVRFETIEGLENKQNRYLQRICDQTEHILRTIGPKQAGMEDRSKEGCTLHQKKEDEGAVVYHGTPPPTNATEIVGLAGSNATDNGFVIDVSTNDTDDAGLEDFIAAGNNTNITQVTHDEPAAAGGGLSGALDGLFSYYGLKNPGHKDENVRYLRQGTDRKVDDTASREAFTS